MDFLLHVPTKIQIPTNSYYPGQDIWNKLEKFSKTKQGEKSLISTLACFLTAISKVEFVGGRLCARLCLNQKLKFS